MKLVFPFFWCLSTFSENVFKGFRSLNYTLSKDFEAALCDCICFECGEMKARRYPDVKWKNHFHQLWLKEGVYSGTSVPVNRNYTHNRHRRRSGRRVKTQFQVTAAFQLGIVYIMSHLSGGTQRTTYFSSQYYGSCIVSPPLVGTQYATCSSAKHYWPSVVRLLSGSSQCTVITTRSPDALHWWANPQVILSQMRCGVCVYVAWVTGANWTVCRGDLVRRNGPNALREKTHTKHIQPPRFSDNERRGFMALWVVKTAKSSAGGHSNV